MIPYDCRGFTLVELVLTISISSMVGFSVISFFVFASKQLHLNQHLNQLNSKIEYVHSTIANDLANIKNYHLDTKSKTLIKKSNNQMIDVIAQNIDGFAIAQEDSRYKITIIFGSKKIPAYTSIRWVNEAS